MDFKVPLLSGKNNNKWKGGKRIFGGRTKYYFLRKPFHKRAIMGGYVQEHIIIAEKVLGKYLPENAVVHHINNDGLNNANSNLVICQDDEYHKLLHKRERALNDCGHASWLKCKFCGQYDATENLKLIKSRKYGAGYHPKCQSEYDKKRRCKR